MTVELIIIKLVLLVILFCFSAFFSASETALFSLDAIKIKRFNQEGKNTHAIIRLLENPLRCLTTILAGNALVNIAISSISTVLFIDLFGEKGLPVAIAAVTLALLVLGEVTPKTIAIYNNEKVASMFAGPLYFFHRLITPFLFLATRVCDAIITVFHWQPRKEPTLTEEEFKTVMEVGHRHGVVAKNEKEMVVSILELTTTTADEVMTPRTDIRALSVEADMDDARHLAARVKHARLPVYKDSLDNIVGFVETKDLFLQESKPLTELVRPVEFVPVTKKIDELIKDFYKKGMRVAMIVDEYGGTAGLVTLEDILEEVFGEIEDEMKAKEELVVEVGPGVYRLSGRTPVYKVNEDCRVQIPPGDYETIAGYLLFVFGKIPVEGEEVAAAGGVFVIEKLSGRRIKSVLLKKS
jgi:putative hemolysin